MQNMDLGLFDCPELSLLPEDLTEYMNDDNLDPDILYSFLTEIDFDGNSEVPALTDCADEASPESATRTSRRLRKRPAALDSADTQRELSPKRPRKPRAACDRSPSPAEVFSPPSPENPSVHLHTPSLPFAPSCVIDIQDSKNGKSQTIRLPPFIRLSHTAIILVPVTSQRKCHSPPLSPVNGAAVPVQPSSSPSGSLSDLPSVCVSPQSLEMSPIKTLPATQEVPQSVKDYIKQTKAFISKACDDLGNGLTMTSNYVETKVVQRDPVRTGKSANKSFDKELDVMGETERRKHTVALQQIFERRQGSRAKSYNLLVGKAGMGKSTCIKKLCLDWSKNCIPQFDFVFLLDGRLLTLSEPRHSLQTLLLSLSSLAPPCSDPDTVFDQILSSPKRVLLIFDGFENLRDFELLVQPLEKDLAPCLQKDKKQCAYTVRQLCSAILHRVLLPGCSLLLASRPRGSATFLLRKLDNILEVSGFSTLEVETYVKRYFPDPEVQSSAINRLRKFDYLTLLCWNPGICRLVCSILQSQPDLDTLPKTLTRICYEVLRIKLETACKNEEETQSKQKVEEDEKDSNEIKTKSKPQVRTRRRASRQRRRKCKSSDEEEKGLMSELSFLAWEAVKSNSSKISVEFSISSRTKEIGLRTGLLTAAVVGGKKRLTTAVNEDDVEETHVTVNHTTQSEGEDEHEILSWSDPFLQSYLAAVHLSLSSGSLIKTLPFQTPSKVRRPQREEFELSQRFAAGLLFQKTSELLWLHPTEDKKFCDTVLTRRKALSDHLRNLPFGHLRPSHILDLCHFVYEGSFTHDESTEDSGCSELAAHFVDNFPETLTFNGVPLCKADVYAIQNILQHKGVDGRSFYIDVQDSGSHISGLRSIVGLSTVSTYRACTADVIALWEELENQKEDGLLCDAVAKFKINPFKATEICHVEHLSKLVDIHMSKKLSESRLNSILSEGVPGIKALHELVLELGPEKGPLALPMLWKSLSGLHNLQHMDLENNKIGDDGARNLAMALVSLSSLETLNLSQNNVGDNGAKTLAGALRNLPKLDRLSLHSNAISDEGACSLAVVLPHLAALSELDIRYNKLTDVGAQSLGSSLKQCRHMKSLRMWSEYIPYGVFERLQQQDHRITGTF